MIKQRFVGFVVLVAIAVIFWPIVFVTPENADDFELPVFEMPPKPAVAVSERREPVLDKVDQSILPEMPERQPPIVQPVDVASPMPDVALVDADEEPEQQASALERAEFDEQGLPISWELQVATFSNAERAEEISQLLRDKGHKAYVSPIILDDQRLFRVMIGPKLQKQRLIEIQPAINDYFSVESFIVRFTPI
ncbi:MAG: SPOR domain-containing protein [Pseudomonadota bacterium]|nr:SPOR domain-containing protein [Pseudomonadota bacterium]MEC7075703.1 SPOR domain-containing protein [Pseudomonadota bacterium]